MKRDPIRGIKDVRNANNDSRTGQKCCRFLTSLGGENSVNILKT
jgi:hypothetical protein